MGAETEGRAAKPRAKEPATASDDFPRLEPSATHSEADIAVGIGGVAEVAVGRAAVDRVVEPGTASDDFPRLFPPSTTDPKVEVAVRIGREVETGG